MNLETVNRGTANRGSANRGTVNTAHAFGSARTVDLGDLNLDTIAFERLVVNARSQIPRHAPGWTDHNLHDPGMTIVDLLGWIVDQQIYRLGFISDRYLEAFAALLGQRRVPPRAASGLVWPECSVPVPIGLQAGAAMRSKPQTDAGVVLAHDVLLTDAQLVSVSSVRSTTVCSTTEHDHREVALSIGFGGPATTIDVGRGSSLVLRFDRPLVRDIVAPVSVGFDVVPIDENIGQHNSDQHNSDQYDSDQNRYNQQDFGPCPPWGPLVFDYRAGDMAWTEVALIDDATAALTQTGVVRLDVPSVGSTVGPSELRLRFDQGLFPIAPSIAAVAANVLSVIQQQVEPAVTLAEGNGVANQTMQFDAAGVVLDPVVMVDGEPWEPQSDFCASGPRDHHYVLLPDGALFGNGINGKRPERGAALGLGPVTRTAGEAGNLRAGLGWMVDGVTDWSGRNCGVFSGGADRSTVDELIASARAVATERQNVLTNADLASAALTLPGFGVRRAEVIAGYDPAVGSNPGPQRMVSGTRSLVVFPQRDPETEAEPVPVGYLQAVSDALEPGRVLGERLVVLAPQVVVVDVDVDVAVSPGVDAVDVKRQVGSALRRRLSVLDRRGRGEASTNTQTNAPWVLGRPVTSEEIQAVVAGVDGVMVVTDCKIARSDAPDVERDEYAECMPTVDPVSGPITLARHGLATLGEVVITATTGQARKGGV